MKLVLHLFMKEIFLQIVCLVGVFVLCKLLKLAVFSDNCLLIEEISVFNFEISEFNGITCACKLLILVFNGGKIYEFISLFTESTSFSANCVFESWLFSCSVLKEGN